MLNHNIAAKAFIVNDAGEILCIKRRPNDVHNPGAWDLPGGRLEEGESPFEGVQRETREEVSLEVTVHNPLTIHHFTRQDGQLITLIVFLCKQADSGQPVQLSEEHTEYKWLSIDDAYETLHEAFRPDIEAYKKHFAA